MKKHILQCDYCGAVVEAAAAIYSPPPRSTASARNLILSFLIVLGIVGAIVGFIKAGSQTSTPTATDGGPAQPTPSNSTAEPAQPAPDNSTAEPTRSDTMQPFTSAGASPTQTEYQGETASDNVDAEVSGALDNWAKAYESNDPTLIANCYADQVDRYFLRQNVTNTFVHDYMEAWFKDHDSRVTMFRIKDVAFQNETATTVQLRLVKEVVTTNSKGAAGRLTPSQLSLKEVAGEWKITSERDFK